MVCSKCNTKLVKVQEYFVKEDFDTDVITVIYVCDCSTRVLSGTAFRAENK